MGRWCSGLVAAMWVSACSAALAGEWAHCFAVPAFSATLSVEVTEKNGRLAQYALTYRRYISANRSSGYRVALEGHGFQQSYVVDSDVEVPGTWLNHHRGKEEGESTVEMPYWLSDLMWFHLEPGVSEQSNMVSDHRMAGVRYVTLRKNVANKAGGLAEATFAVKLDESRGTCEWLRATWAPPGKRAVKKVFLHWQTRAGVRVFDSVHVEDAQTLNRVVYRFENVDTAPP